MYIILGNWILVVINVLWALKAGVFVKAGLILIWEWSRVSNERPGVVAGKSDQVSKSGFEWRAIEWKTNLINVWEAGLVIPWLLVVWLVLGKEGGGVHSAEWSFVAPSADLSEIHRTYFRAWENDDFHFWIFRKLVSSVFQHFGVISWTGTSAERMR